MALPHRSTRTTRTGAEWTACRLMFEALELLAAVKGAGGVWERPARPGENCKCGRPAVVVYLTEKFGEVPYCGIPDGGGDA